MREIVLDTETTGMDPATGDRLVEIGCVELINQMPSGKVFHRYLNPERDVPAEAAAVHGLTSEFLSDKPVFTEIVAEFLDFVGSDRLVIHNAEFDMKFINSELERAGFRGIPMLRVNDTLYMARARFPGAPASLDALCRRFGVDLSGRDKHGALLDAELLAKVYLELIGGRQRGLGLASAGNGGGDGIVGGAGTVGMASLQRQGARPVRHFEPSPDELAEHEKMLGKLTQPLWKVV